MGARAAIACLLLSLPLVAAAMGQAGGAAPAKKQQAEATRAKLDASRGQAQDEDKKVQDLKKRVDALESNSKTSREALEERDRKIAELERQLDAERHP